MCEGGLKVRAETLQDWCGRLFHRAGVPGVDAELVAALLVEADLRGVFSHGTVLAPQYLGWLRSGELNPQPRIRTVDDDGGPTVRMHGDDGLGHVVSTRGMQVAVDRARRHGVGVVAAQKAGHNGAGFHYVEMATAEGMIGFTTQSPPPLKTPAYSWLAEGFRPPLTIGVPARDEPPVVLDLCANVLGSGEMDLLMAHGPHMLDNVLGREVPAGLPAALKGYGLAYVLAMISSFLAGGQLEPGEPDSFIPGSLATLLVAIDIEHFVPREQFEAQVDAFCRGVRATKATDEVRRHFMVPGSDRWGRRAEHARDGIPLSGAHAEALRRAAAEWGEAFQA